MVDVDHGTAGPCQEGPAENLHVPGKHNQLDWLALQQAQDLLFLHGFTLLRDRDDFERDLEQLGPHGAGVMIGNNHRDFDLQLAAALPDRKSTRLNSSHVSISYAVFCLKKKTK